MCNDKEVETKILLESIEQSINRIKELLELIDKEEENNKNV
jgi:hypothetical protein